MRHHLLMLCALMLPLAGAAQDQMTVTMTSPGSLPELLGDAKQEVKSLKIIGDINGTDIALIREIGKGKMNAQWQYESNLMILDLSEANIVEGGDPYNTSWPYPTTVNNEIGEDMFSRFAALVELKLPQTVTKIGKYGINSCTKLAELTLPSDLETLTKWSISYCQSLTEVTVPSKTKLIEEAAFTGSGLESVTIESEDIELQPGAFLGLDHLVNIIASENNATFTSIDGVLFSKDGKSLILYPSARPGESYIVPDNVTEISAYGFYGASKITEVSLPSTVETIGDYAFDGCSLLTGMAFPESLKTIGKFAFAACPEFKVADMGSTAVVSIGASAFAGAQKLENVVLSSVLETVGEAAFNNGTYKNITLAPSVVSIGKNAFALRSLEHVYAEGSVPALCDGDVFGQDMIASILFQTPTAVLHVPEGCLDIYKEADGFRYFFNFVDDLKKDTESLALTVETPGSLPELVGDSRKMSIKTLKVSGDINGTDIAYIRQMGVGTTDARGKNVSSLNLLDLTEANIIAGGDPYDGDACYTANDVIGTDMFAEFGAMTELRLPKSASLLSSRSVADCPSLAVVMLPESLNRIESKGINNCESVTEITLPESLRVIEEYAFDGCGIRSVMILSSDIDIKAGAFLGLEDFTEFNTYWENPSIYALNGVLYATGGTRLLLYPAGRKDENFIISDGIKEIGANAFYKVENLKNVKLPESLEIIEKQAFYGCNSIENIELVNSLRKIGADAFSGCGSLENVYSTAETPAECDGDVFGQENTENKATLHVMHGLRLTYEEADGFRYFSNIVDDMQNSGVESIIDDADDAEFFDLHGLRVSAPVHGLYIMRTPDGKTRKVAVR